MKDEGRRETAEGGMRGWRCLRNKGVKGSFSFLVFRSWLGLGFCETRVTTAISVFRVRAETVGNCETRGIWLP